MYTALPLTSSASSAVRSHKQYPQFLSDAGQGSIFHWKFSSNAVEERGGPDEIS